MSQHDPPLPTRGAWLRFNADGVLLALLAILAGLDLFSPQYSDLVRNLGYVPPMFYVWTTCYLAAGALMLLGFIWQAMASEPPGRLLLFIAFAMETARSGVVLGWFHHDLLIDYAVGVVVISVCVARAGVLMTRQGLTIVIGGRR